MMATVAGPLMAILGMYLPLCTGQCEFPTSLRDSWYSADKGMLNFTVSHLIDYPVYLSTNVSSMTFSCEEINSGRYILKGISTFMVFFGNQLRPYLCLTITQVSQDVYYYYVINRLESSNSDRIFVRDDNFTVTADDVCNRDVPYETSTYIMLVREGASVSSMSRICPNLMLRTFTNVSIVASDGSVRCDDVHADVCTTTSALTIGYQSCDPNLIFSAGGEFVCLYDVTEGGMTYVALWNTDTNLTDGKTYRTTCYAIEEVDGVTFGTEYPNRCHYNQTSQYVPSEGVFITMQNVTENCVPTDSGSKEETVAVAAIIGGVTGGVVLLLAIIFVLIGCLCCKKSKPVTVVVVKEAKIVEHRSKDTDVILDVEEDGNPDLDRDITDRSSTQMSVYSAYLPRSSAKSDKTVFRKPTFGSPLYRNGGRADDPRHKRSVGTEKRQYGKLVENGLHGMEDETVMSFPVEQTSFPDIHKEVYQNGGYAPTDEGFDKEFAFQNLAVSATDSYKLLVKNMKRGEKQLLSDSPPTHDRGQVVHVRSSPPERRRNTKPMHNSPKGRTRFQKRDVVNPNSDLHPASGQKGQHVYASRPEGHRNGVEGPNMRRDDGRYGGRPTGKDIYGVKYVEDITTMHLRNQATDHRTSSFGSTRDKSAESEQRLSRTNDTCNSASVPSSATNSNPVMVTSGTSWKPSGNKDNLTENHESPGFKGHLVDTGTATDDTKMSKHKSPDRNAVLPMPLHNVASVGIQTEREKTLHGPPNNNTATTDDNSQKSEAWRHPLLNYEYNSGTESTSTSVPKVISGYDMAKYNPPNIESSKHQDRLARRLGLTSTDMIWCIDPNSRGPKMGTTYNLGSIMNNKNYSRRLGRQSPRNRMVTPWR